MRVKICGITNYEDAIFACEVGADALGFNFAQEAKKRNRYVEPDIAYGIIERLPSEVQTVAVCVNESVDEMQTYLEHMDFVQLHGEESVETTNALNQKAIKVFRLNEHIQLSDIDEHKDCFAYLVDAYDPNARGGTGTTCDWDKAATITKLGKHVFLAGGLTPENVTEAIEQVRPYAVDTAGGVESSPGKKDHERIRAFIHHVKQASLS